jgi:hypothetical protein
MSATGVVPGLRPGTITPAAGDDTGGQAGERPGEGPRPGAQQSPGQRGLRALVGLVVSFVVPLLSYDLIRPHVGSSAMALALAGAIPVVYTLAILVVTRRLSPIGVVGAVTFGISVLVSWASGGSALAIELQDPALFGLLGIAFLVSVAIGRPLHPVILRLLGRGDPRYTSIASRAERRTSMVITTVLGLTLLAHAGAIAVLALTQSTSTFVALQHPVGLPIFGLGLACLFFYRSRLQARQSAAATLAVRDDEPADGERGDDERGDDEAAGTS